MSQHEKDSMNPVPQYPSKENGYNRGKANRFYEFSSKEEILKGLEYSHREELQYSHENVLHAMDEYANQDKWIRVEDELPKVGQMVNCYGSEWPEGCSCKYTENGFLWPNVTHWQPLPKPPQQQIEKLNKQYFMEKYPQNVI